jgi:hypothetical protein
VLIRRKHDFQQSQVSREHARCCVITDPKQKPSWASCYLWSLLTWQQQQQQQQQLGQRIPNQGGGSFLEEHTPIYRGGRASP